MIITTSPPPSPDFLSPLKRKRAAPPAPDTREIPETPWRTTNPPTVPAPASPSSAESSSSAPSSSAASPNAQSCKLIASMRRMKLQHIGDSGVVVVTDDEEDAEQLQDAGEPKRRRASKEAEPLDDGKEHDIPKRLRSPPPEVTIEAVEKETEEEDEEMGGSDVEGYGIAYVPTPAQRDLRRQKRLAAIKEYKSRETKEARAKRAEQRRRRRRSSTLVTGGSSAGEEPRALRGVSEEKPRKAVHFAE